MYNSFLQWNQMPEIFQAELWFQRVRGPYTSNVDCSDSQIYFQNLYTIHVEVFYGGWQITGPWGDQFILFPKADGKSIKMHQWHFESS